MIQDILTIPNNKLYKKSSIIKQIDDDIIRLYDDMLDTMYNARGIGLAAIQIGVPKAIFVMDLSPNKNHPIAMINPSITNRTGDIIIEEGCLSIPGCTHKVARSETVWVKSSNISGKLVSRQYIGFAAVCVQHEIDHINAILISSDNSSIWNKLKSFVHKY